MYVIKYKANKGIVVVVVVVVVVGGKTIMENEVAVDSLPWPERVY